MLIRTSHKDNIGSAGTPAPRWGMGSAVPSASLATNTRTWHPFNLTVIAAFGRACRRQGDTQQRKIRDIVRKKASQIEKDTRLFFAQYRLIFRCKTQRQAADREFFAVMLRVVVADAFRVRFLLAFAGLCAERQGGAKTRSGSRFAIVFSPLPLKRIPAATFLLTIGRCR